MRSSELTLILTCDSDCVPHKSENTLLTPLLKGEIQGRDVGWQCYQENEPGPEDNRLVG
jgi:hypothetical protein